jgi:hypothetical protein
MNPIQNTKTSLVFFILSMICYGISLIPLYILIGQLWKFSPMRLTDRIEEELKQDSKPSLSKQSLSKQLDQLKHWLPRHHRMKDLLNNPFIMGMIRKDQTMIFGMIIWFTVMTVLGSVFLGISLSSKHVLTIIGLIVLLILLFLIIIFIGISALRDPHPMKGFLILVTGAGFSFTTIKLIHECKQ